MPFIYRHIRHDTNQPFYIGVGTRIHRAYTTYRRNKLWQRIAAKTTYDVEILMVNLTTEQAMEKEKEFIALYKRINDGGTLANITIGGEGTQGVCGPLNARFGKKLSPEHAAKLRAIHLNRVATPEQRFNMSMAAKASSKKDYTKFRQKQIEATQRAVIKYSIDGCILAEYISISKAAKENNVDASSIAAACKGKLKTCGGFIWEYTDNQNTNV